VRFKINSSLDKLWLDSLNCVRVFRAKDLLDAVNKSLGSQSDSFLSDWLEFTNVAIRDNLVFSRGQTVIDSHSNFVGLISEFSEISGFSIGLSERESGLQVISNYSLISKSFSSEWSLWSRVVGVDHGIPDSMEFVSSVVALQREVVSSFVAVRKVFSVSITGVERLMDIPIIVDEKSQGKRFTLLCCVDIFHDRLVGNGICCVTSSKPEVDIWHGHGDVLSVVTELDI